MAMIVAASSLHHSLKDLKLEERRETQRKVYAVPVLFFELQYSEQGEEFTKFI